MQGETIGSEYGFQLGMSNHHNTLYIANRFFHAALENDNVVFYPKVVGKVNYPQPLLAKEALQNNLFQSIVRFQQQAKSNKALIKKSV